MEMLDIYAKAEIGKSLAGINLGEKLEIFLPYVDQKVDGKKVGWNIDIRINNEGILFYEWPKSYGGGYSIFINDPKLELLFTNKGTLCHIMASEGYKGELIDGVKIGDKLINIKHPLVLDDQEDVHYLSDGQGGVIEGIYFVAGGFEVGEYPNDVVEEVKVYDYNLV